METVGRLHVVAGKLEILQVQRVQNGEVGQVGQRGLNSCTDFSAQVKFFQVVLQTTKSVGVYAGQAVLSQVKPLDFQTRKSVCRDSLDVVLGQRQFVDDVSGGAHCRKRGHVQVAAVDDDKVIIFQLVDDLGLTVACRDGGLQVGTLEWHSVVVRQQCQCESQQERAGRCPSSSHSLAWQLFGPYSGDP